MTKNLVKKLLTKNPAKRLGAGKTGAADIKAHELFEHVNFDEIYAKRANTPWIPASGEKPHITL